MCTIGRCGDEKHFVILHRETQIHIVMIDIPTNERFDADYETVVADVLNQLTTGCDKYGEGTIGTAYIDWGVTSDIYQNCPTKSIADRVARAFKEKGYYVYVQRMGIGNRRILPGTPVAYRIYREARKYSNWEEI